MVELKKEADSGWLPTSSGPTVSCLSLVLSDFPLGYLFLESLTSSSIKVMVYTLLINYS